MKKIMIIFMFLTIAGAYGPDIQGVGARRTVPLLSTALANNLSVANVTLADQDTVNDTYDIEFDVGWDNSWYISGAPSLTANWDAAWVFAKFSKKTDGIWSDWAHCTLLNTGGVAATGSQLAFADNQGDTVYRGAFIYRNAAGSGTVDWDNNQVRWDYGADGVGDTDEVKIKVIGIEMVYIPEGSFYVGDEDNDNNNCFFTADGTYVKDEPLGPYQITSEGAITVGTADGNLYYDQDTTSDGDGMGPIPANFPKGFNDFYIMKYEVTQWQYVEFLNMLPRAMQNYRTASRTANQYVMSNTVNVNFRSGIRAPSSIPEGAITFGCDLDGITANNTSTGDGVFNEADDGQTVAANWLSWVDGAAYADWAALRPFTELELEKAARGGQAVVDDEYAWGNTTLEATATSLANSGEAGEVPNQGNMNYNSVTVDGPFRVGSFADSASSRTNAGASYYGVMELSGSLYERPVTVGNDTGRLFIGTHGDGALSVDGYATNSDWPGYSAGKVSDSLGTGFRGGSVNVDTTGARVSNRHNAALSFNARGWDYGARCVRTAP